MVRTLLTLSILLSSSWLFASGAHASEEYSGELVFDPGKASLRTAGSWHVMEYEGLDSLLDPGKPALPATEINLALPAGAREVRIASIRAEWRELARGLNVRPAARPRKLSDPEPLEDPFVIDPAVYGLAAAFPAEPLKMGHRWDLDGQDFLTLLVLPFRYHPRSGRLELATRISFDVVWEPGHVEARGANLSERGRRYAIKRLRRMAFNPEDVVLPPAGGFSSRALDPGQYDHVIITPADYETDWAPLTEWRTKKGLPSRVVTLEYIQGNYSGNSDPDRIQAFVKDAKKTWGTTLFTLGGDTAWIPYHTKSVMGHSVPNDTYYADFDQDWKIEVGVTRASVQSHGEIADFIAKVLAYEKNPPAGNYGATAFFFAFNLDSKTPSEVNKKKIDADHLPAYFTLDVEYDSEAGKHKADCIAYINAGSHLLNHSDHGGTNVMGVGSVNHGDHLDKSDASGFVNGDRQSVVYSIGCWTNHYPADDCIGETWVKNTGGGAVCYNGNSSYGWYASGTPTSYSMYYDRMWWKALFDDGWILAGDTLAESKMYTYPFPEVYKFIFTSLTCVGDAAMPIWTGDPQALIVSHDDQLFTGPGDFTVYAADGQGAVADALVCLMKDNEVYARGFTDASGFLTLSIDPVSTGILDVTVTARDALPYEGQAQVYATSPPPVLNDANPASGLHTSSTSVTLTGQHFQTTPPPEVFFGDEAATSLVLVDDQTVTCDAPGHVIPGLTDVKIRTPFGEAVLPLGFEYLPVPGFRQNLVDRDTANLIQPAMVNIAVTGPAGSAYLCFASTGPGPLPTPWGNMGLDLPIHFLFASKVGLQGYQVVPLAIQGYPAPIDFYIHCLIDDQGVPVWGMDGGNPNGSGSIFFHVTDG